MPRRGVQILLFITAVAVPGAVAASDRTEAEPPPGEDLVTQLQAGAAKAMAAAIAAGERGNATLRHLHERLADKMGSLKGALSSEQEKFESVGRDAAQAVDHWSDAANAWLLDLQERARAALETFRRNEAENKPACPEIHV